MGGKLTWKRRIVSDTAMSSGSSIVALCSAVSRVGARGVAQPGAQVQITCSWLILSEYTWVKAPEGQRLSSENNCARRSVSGAVTHGMGGRRGGEWVTCLHVLTRRLAGFQATQNLALPVLFGSLACFLSLASLPLIVTPRPHLLPQSILFGLLSHPLLQVVLSFLLQLLLATLRFGVGGTLRTQHFVAAFC